MIDLVESWRAFRFALGSRRRLTAARHRLVRRRDDAARAEARPLRASRLVGLTGPDPEASPCHGCEYCARLCPAKALRLDVVEGEASPRSFLLDPLRCVGCQLCVQICPVEALAPSEPAAPMLDRADGVVTLIARGGSDAG